MNEERPKKVVIRAFKDKQMQEKAEQPNEYFLPVNPEKYSQNYKISYDKKNAKGSQGTELKFKSSAPEELKMDFVIDATNTIMGYKADDSTKDSVEKQVDQLKAVVYDLSGEIHQPKFLKVIGLGLKNGKENAFPCILSNLDINYTLFRPDGSPLRAKVNLTFLNFKETERRVREEGKNSPDLTHIRQVPGKTSLPLMTYEIYRNPAYYLEVAKANGLNNFRRLQPGQTLRFPPIEKTT